MAEQFRASDGYDFALRKYAAVGTAKGHLIFVHGIRSHGGWYEKSCTELATLGFNVSFLDRRGAGRNENDRGDCPNYERLVLDICEYVDSIRSVSKQSIFLAGISWGGKTVMPAAQKLGNQIAGVVLIAPGFVPLVSVPLIERLKILFTRFVSPRTHFPIPLNDPKLFTADTDGQNLIEHDPLGLTTATARFLVNSVRLDLSLKRMKPAVTCPVLLLSAGRDRIADIVKSKTMLERLVQKEYFTEIIYPYAEHTLEFEKNCPFVRDIATWCERILSKN